LSLRENGTLRSAAEEDVRALLSNVLDPELGIDIISLGLVYRIDIDGSRVGVLMTLTVPGCPMSATIRSDVDATLRSLPWISDVHVELTFDPPWTPERLTPHARILLGR
jgi:metal-sulfur cluster biosynthetic enzyme